MPALQDAAPEYAAEPRGRRPLLNEAKVLKSIWAPEHSVQVSDFGQAPDGSHLIMEYLPKVGA